MTDYLKSAPTFPCIYSNVQRKIAGSVRKYWKDEI